MYNVHELQWYGFIDTWSRSWLWLRLTRQKRWQAAVSGESGATQGCVAQCVVPSTLRRSLGLPDVSIQLERCHIAGHNASCIFSVLRWISEIFSRPVIWLVVEKSHSTCGESFSPERQPVRRQALVPWGGEVCQSCRCKTSSPPFCQRWRWEGERRWWI